MKNKNENEILRDLNDYFEAWTKLDERFQHVFRSSTEAVSNLQNITRHFADSADLEAAFKDLVRTQELTQFDIVAIGQQLETVSKFGASIQRQMAPVFEPLQRSFDSLPPATQRALATLAEHGWFLDLDLPLSALWEVEQAILGGNVAEAEAALIDHYQVRLRDIENFIVERFSRRERFVRSGFSAHRRMDYAASIPLLFAQTDGICMDVTNKHLFMKDGGKPETAKYVQRIAADRFRAALLSPLTLRLPISASKSSREPDFDGLNRHTVLHGESLDYDTEKNATKAVSLIHYVAHVLSLSKEP